MGNSVNWVNLTQSDGTGQSVKEVDWQIFNNTCE